MALQNNKNNQFEETLLKAADLLIKKAESQGEKALFNLFKSAILKKYKDQYDVEFQHGVVKKETVDKSIDFLFEDTCFRFRALPQIEDSAKEEVINRAQTHLCLWKAMVIQWLTDLKIKLV